MDLQDQIRVNDHLIAQLQGQNLALICVLKMVCAQSQTARINEQNISDIAASLLPIEVADATIEAVHETLRTLLLTKP